jgi:hypothetical protein
LDASVRQTERDQADIDREITRSSDEGGGE